MDFPDLFFFLHILIGYLCGNTEVNSPTKNMLIDKRLE